MLEVEVRPQMRAAEPAVVPQELIRVGAVPLLLFPALQQDQRSLGVLQQHPAPGTAEGGSLQTV